MPDVKWIKVSTDMFTNNRKIKQIELMENGDSILVIWLKLMLLAGNVNDGGAIYITPEIPYTDETLARELRRPIQIVKSALSIFEQYGMIEIVDDFLRLPSWEKYQSADKLAELREYNRIAQQKTRTKKKISQNVNDVSKNVNDLSMTRQDIEEDKDIDIDYQSLFLTGAHAHTHAHEDGNVENSADNLSDDNLSDDNLSKEAQDKLKKHLREQLKQKYLGGTLGQGVVMMSDEQFDHLCDVLSIEEINKYCGIIVECEGKGKLFKRKTHYKAILEMAEEDRKV